jgi:hypothetical protein
MRIVLKTSRFIYVEFNHDVSTFSSIASNDGVITE